MMMVMREPMLMAPGTGAATDAQLPVAERRLRLGSCDSDTRGRVPPRQQERAARRLPPEPRCCFVSDVECITSVMQ